MNSLCELKYTDRLKLFSKNEFIAHYTNVFVIDKHFNRNMKKSRTSYEGVLLSGGLLTGFVLPEHFNASRSSRTIVFQKVSPSSRASLRVSQMNSKTQMTEATNTPPINTMNTPPTLAKPNSLAPPLPLSASCSNQFSDYFPLKGLVNLKSVKLPYKDPHRASLSTICF